AINWGSIGASSFSARWRGPRWWQPSPNRVDRVRDQRRRSRAAPTLPGAVLAPADGCRREAYSAAAAAGLDAAVGGHLPRRASGGAARGGGEPRAGARTGRPAP